jgi:hypothetical protein
VGVNKYLQTRAQKNQLAVHDKGDFTNEKEQDERETNNTRKTEIG